MGKISVVYFDLHKLLKELLRKTRDTRYVIPCVKMSVFRDVEPCGVLDTGRRFRGATALTMEEVSTRETLVIVYQAARRNVPECCHLQLCVIRNRYANY
jgi:hypothetical protein